MQYSCSCGVVEATLNPVQLLRLPTIELAPRFVPKQVVAALQNITLLFWVMSCHVRYASVGGELFVTTQKEQYIAEPYKKATLIIRCLLHACKSQRLL